MIVKLEGLQSYSLTILQSCQIHVGLTVLQSYNLPILQLYNQTYSVSSMPHSASNCCTQSIVARNIFEDRRVGLRLQCI